MDNEPIWKTAVRLGKEAGEDAWKDVKQTYSQGYKEGLLKAVEVVKEYDCQHTPSACDHITDGWSCKDCIIKHALEALINKKE